MKFYYFSKQKQIKKIFCYTSKGAPLANKFQKTLNYLPKKLPFEKNSGNWLRGINVVRNWFIKENHFLTKLTPIHSFLEGSEGYVCKKMLEKNRNKVHSPK